MPIVHHPDVTTVMTCSAGSQPEALCAVVTSHLSMCPECMRELSVLEEIGVSLFECSLSDHKMAASTVPSRSEVLEQTREAPKTPAKGDVPWPLMPILGHSLDAISWHDVHPGISTFEIALSPNAKGDLRLLRLAPGTQLPEHGHVGEELTLILSGSCSDENGTFGIGDMSDLDDDDRHTVVAGPDGCIILVGSETEPAYLTVLEEIEV
jgi:putative transcriptional regulator